MADEALLKDAAHAAANGGVMGDVPEIQSDGPKQFAEVSPGQAIRDEIEAIQGNEGAFNGIEPSTVFVSLNESEMTLTGSVPADVLAALYQGRLEGGLPDRFYNTPTAGLGGS